MKLLRSVMTEATNISNGEKSVAVDIHRAEYRHALMQGGVMLHSRFGSAENRRPDLRRVSSTWAKSVFGHRPAESAEVSPNPPNEGNGLETRFHRRYYLGSRVSGSEFAQCYSSD